MKKFISVLIIIMLILMSIQNTLSVFATSDSDTVNIYVDLTSLKTTVNETTEEIKAYTQDEFDTFVSDFNSNNLPEIYITEFLYDGAGMVKTPDLDDFIEEDSNDAKIKTLSITAINVNTTGNVEFYGELKGGMIAVNTNDKDGDITLILNNVNLDTDSKKVPAIYVYNKDITYTEHKVTIKTATNSKNYLVGGKFKKVSLVGSDELDSYLNKYSGEAKTYYESYTNYYGIYTSEQIENILFAKVQADNEDLAEGDPYYFYKGAGAISSDIDLYFGGDGYLSVTSKNKEGIETKGNLNLGDGSGDYYVFAEDDCLNTTTSSSSNQSARNTLTINVNSLYAIVDSEANEGDCIDSNGTLVINGGKIFAIAHPTSQDDGLDSEKGTYINGGIVVATGNMSDSISNDSNQDFIKLNFSNRQEAGTLVCITDTEGNPIIAYESDRTFTTLTLSTPDFEKTTYYVYTGGIIMGEEENGLYTKIDNYGGGLQQQWTGGGQTGAPDNNQGQMDPNGNGDMTPPGGENGNMNSPDGERENTPTPPTENPNGNGQTPPEKPEGKIENGQMPGGQGETLGETSKEFTISSSNHTFNNVSTYTAQDETDNKQEENQNDNENQEEKNDSNENNDEQPQVEVVLSSISITTRPNKTSYISGEKFDKTGMVVTAYYSNGTSNPVTNYTVTPSGTLLVSDTKVTISYTENGVTKQTTQMITVSAKNNPTSNTVNNISNNTVTSRVTNTTNNTLANSSTTNKTTKTTASTISNRTTNNTVKNTTTNKVNNITNNSVDSNLPSTGKSNRAVLYTISGFLLLAVSYYIKYKRL